MINCKAVGYLIWAFGTGLWVYGYFVSGAPPLIDWDAHVPAWIAKFLPNRESEIGMLLTFVAMIPMYWPSKRKNRRNDGSSDPIGAASGMMADAPRTSPEAISEDDIVRRDDVHSRS